MVRVEFAEGKSFTLPRLVYSGDHLAPNDIDVVAPMDWRTSYPYHVFNVSGDLLYLHGPSRLPAKVATG